MYRVEACAFLTKIAENELMNRETSKEMLKERDLIICEPNKILDVLATDDKRKFLKTCLSLQLEAIATSGFFTKEVRKKAKELYCCINEKEEEHPEFYELCNEVFLPTRCKDCPNYKGCKNDKV